MAKVNVDPEQLRRFARELDQFNHDLDGLITTLNARMNHLEQSWQDQEQRKFAEQFRQAALGLKRFIDNSQEHVKFLGKKATHIENYLNQR